MVYIKVLYIECGYRTILHAYHAHVMIEGEGKERRKFGKG